MRDISRAINVINGRHDTYVSAETYYNGAEAEVFASQKFRNLFKADSLDYIMNYAKTVVDTVQDRLELASVQGTDDASNEAINRIWEGNELILDQHEIHRRALVFGECYTIVWPDEEGDVQITYNSPLTTAVIYDVENPRKKEFAAKMWLVAEEGNKSSVRVNLYYADRIEKYQSIGTGNGQVTDKTQFNLLESVENPFEQVPVFHFRTHKPHGTPEHAAAIAPQDAINKLVSNHMYTVDYQGAPQRYALTKGAVNGEASDFDDDDTDRENINAMKAGPGELWYLQGVDSVGQFTPAQPSVFLEPIMAYVKTMASLTGTPLHYFQNNGQFASGEALRTAEAPLIKKVADRQMSFGATWREIFKFALKIEGIDSDVQVKWQSPESSESSDIWETASLKFTLGIPLDQILFEAGYDTEVIADIMKKIADKKAQDRRDAANGEEVVDAEPNVAGLNAHNLQLQQAAEARKNNATNS